MNYLLIFKKNETKHGHTVFERSIEHVNIIAEQVKELMGYDKIFEIRHLKLEQNRK